MVVPVNALPANPPLGADGPALQGFLKLAGVGKTSTVRVTGPSGVTAVLWLCGHGWEHASYVHANWVGAPGSVDALVAPHVCAGRELTAVLQGGDCLREGGVLIVQISTARGESGQESLLESFGYELVRECSDKRREVLIGRRRGAPILRDAA